jgi:ethanolamine utilization protein EutS
MMAADQTGHTIERVIQEYVPGKQVTLAHMVANPTAELCQKVGVGHAEALGILTLTPGETAIIAGDIALKAAGVEIGFLDRFSGALVVTGSIGSVDEALQSVLQALGQMLGFTVCPCTRT